MTAGLVIGVYSTLVVAASLAGGAIPSRFAINHLRMQLILSFVGGLMLGISLFHLIPHSLEYLLPQESSIDRPELVTQASQAESLGHIHVHNTQYSRAINTTFLSAMIGLLGTFFLIRLFHFHQHTATLSDHEGECTNEQHSHRRLNWGGVVFGLSVHSLMDGVALGSAVLADSTHTASATGLAGFGVFLAVVLHKPLDALSITTLMQANHWSRQSQQAVNAGFATMCPVGAFLVLLLGQSAAIQPEIDWLVGVALGVSGGVFLCISLSDLLPEVQFHTHDRMGLSLALIFGVVAAYAIGFLEISQAH